MSLCVSEAQMHLQLVHAFKTVVTVLVAADSQV